MATSAVNLARLLTIRNDIKDAIEDKGVTIPSGTAFDDYPTYISQISGGGGNEPIYGVSGLYNSATALTRTDNAIGLDFVINSSSGTIDSDFDRVFPWNETEIVQDAAGKFIKFPEMYFRVGADSSHRLTDIAVSKSPSGGGDWYRVDPFMYGCYGASIENDVTLASRSGVRRSVGNRRANYHNYAAATGEGYVQNNLYHHTIVLFLWLIEFAEKDASALFTKVESNVLQNLLTGVTDSLPTPSGFDTVSLQMRYHCIEDFVGNFREFFDGFCGSAVGVGDYAIADPSQYPGYGTTGLNQLGYPSAGSGCIAALGWDESNPFLCMPCEVVSNQQFNTYFCSQNSKGSAYETVHCGFGQGGGMINMSYGTTNMNSSTVGTRLIKILRD